jgi:hypothetical protein
MTSLYGGNDGEFTRLGNEYSLLVLDAPSAQSVAQACMTMTENYKPI